MSDTHVRPDASRFAADQFEATGPTRRAVVLGAAGVVGVGLLAACSGSDSADTSADSSGSGSSTGDAAGSDAAGIIAAADVPVGGGVIVGAVVVTQPVEGEIKAFSSTCTHQGCKVNSVTDGRIRCPCHGSAFDVADGAVVTGPATAGLPEVDVTVVDGEVTAV